MALSFAHLSPAGLRHLVKDMRQALAKEGIQLPQNRAQEVLAQTLGHATWHDAQQHAKATRSTPVSTPSTPTPVEPPTPPFFTPWFDFNGADRAWPSLTPMVAQKDHGVRLLLTLSVFKRQLEDARQEHTNEHHTGDHHSSMVELSRERQWALTHKALTIWGRAAQEADAPEHQRILEVVFPEHYPTSTMLPFVPWLREPSVFQAMGLEDITAPDEAQAFFTLAESWGTQILQGRAESSVRQQWLTGLRALVFQVARQAHVPPDTAWDRIKTPWFEVVAPLHVTAAMTLLPFCRPEGQLALLNRKIQQHLWPDANLLSNHLYGSRMEDPANARREVTAAHDEPALLGIIRGEHPWSTAWKVSLWGALNQHDEAQVATLLKEGETIRILDDQRLEEATQGRPFNIRQQLQRERQAVRRLELATLLVQAVPIMDAASRTLVGQHLVNRDNVQFVLQTLATVAHVKSRDMAKEVLNLIEPQAAARYLTTLITEPQKAAAMAIALPLASSEETAPRRSFRRR